MENVQSTLGTMNAGCIKVKKLTKMQRIGIKMEKFKVGDIIQIKYTDYIGSIVNKAFSTTGEDLFEVMWLTSTARENSLCRKESLKNRRDDENTVWS
jgi:hypothetical protein